MKIFNKYILDHFILLCTSEKTEESENRACELKGVNFQHLPLNPLKRRPLPHSWLIPFRELKGVDKQRKKQVFLLTLFISALIMISSCHNKKENSELKNSGSNYDKIQFVEVVNPQKRSFISEVLITGTARPNQLVTIYSMENGFVKNIMKDIGDIVKKDEIIAELSNPELIRQQQKISAQLKSKKSIYDRLATILEKTPALTTLQMVEEAKADYLSIKAELDAIADRLNFLFIKAPFDGIITKRLVDRGALVQSGLTENSPQGIVELQDYSTMRVIVPLPEPDVSAIRKGMDVTVTFPELPIKPFKVKVSRTAGALDPASKTMQVEINIPNPDNVIKSGMYAKVLMRISNQNNVLSLPVTAQVILEDEFFLLIVEDEMVQAVQLRKGLSNKEYFEVLNHDINLLTQVITQGKGLVKHGQKVKPILKKK